MHNPGHESLENDVLENIYSRRSVRDYLPDDVPDEIIRELIRAGTYAPSAANKQPWRFVVIKNKELIMKLSDKAKELWMDQAAKTSQPELKSLVNMVSRPGFNIFFNAPLLIMIFSAFRCILTTDRLRSGRGKHDASSSIVGNGELLDRFSCSAGPGAGNPGRSGCSVQMQVRGQFIFGYPVKLDMKAPNREENVVLKWIV